MVRKIRPEARFLCRKVKFNRRNPVITITMSDHRYSSWKQFLDAAYWDVELVQ